MIKYNPFVYDTGKEGNEREAFFKVNMLMMVWNYIIVLVLCAFLELTSKRDKGFSIPAFGFIAICLLLYPAIQKVLNSIKFYKDTKIVDFTTTRFFIKKKFSLRADELCFSYKKESAGRGGRLEVFVLYTASEEKIVKLHGIESGYLNKTIMDIIFTCREMGVREIV